jgi:predicted HTH transcriptional regulator
MGALPQFKVTYNPARTCLSMPCFVGDNIINDGTEEDKNVTDEGKNVTNKEENVTNNGEYVVAFSTQKKKSEKRQNQILSLIKGSPKITLSELSENLGVTKRTILRDVNNLIENGLLKREGSNFGGSWIVLDENSLR